MGVEKVFAGPLVPCLSADLVCELVVVHDLDGPPHVRIAENFEEPAL